MRIHREIPGEAVTVRLQNGKEHTVEVRVPKGRDRNPLTKEEKEKKYRDCASLVLSPQQVETSLGMISKLEEVGDISKVMEIVCFP